VAENGSVKVVKRGALAALLMVAAASAVILTQTSIPGCDEEASRDVAEVRIGGERLHLEIAADERTRMKGLSGRTHIERDGGMLFVFPAPGQLSFVMRDCLVDIDILFLDGAGRVVSMHEMKAEAPRGPGEGSPGDLANAAYDRRLRKYPSRFRAQFAIEIRGGRLRELGVQEGDLVRMDVGALKALAK
jgi:uncharacterized membrane protein (UPF0127 family)